jgi:hypothetical protein
MNRVFNPLLTFHFIVILKPSLLPSVRIVFKFIIMSFCFPQRPLIATSNIMLLSTYCQNTNVTLHGAQVAMCGRSVVTSRGSFLQLSKSALKKQYTAPMLNILRLTILYSENETGFNFSRQESEIWTQKFQTSENRMPT